jgi:hypothetical protein
MLEAYVLWFGIVFLIMGVLGFIPPFASGGMLLGIFLLGPLRSIVHLLIGGFALAAYPSSERASRQFFQMLGITYAAMLGAGLETANGAAWIPCRTWLARDYSSRRSAGSCAWAPIRGSRRR